jgi:hypothetical protein
MYLNVFEGKNKPRLIENQEDWPHQDIKDEIIPLAAGGHLSFFIPARLRAF